MEKIIINVTEKDIEQVRSLFTLASYTSAEELNKYIDGIAAKEITLDIDALDLKEREKVQFKMSVICLALEQNRKKSAYEKLMAAANKIIGK